MLKYRHRVVVELDDIATEENSNVFPVRLSQKRISPSEVRMPHHKQRMSFDFVGIASDARAEIKALMDQVVVQSNNCCLIRFCWERSSNVQFLTNLLVSNVEKRLNLWQAAIHNITVEYYDVRKFNVVDMMSSYAKMRQVPTRNQFRTTTELCDWLAREYRDMWSYGMGHDCLDITFFFFDSLRRVHEVKFTVIHIYLKQMDINERRIMLNFLRHMDGREKLKHSLVTDSIREYLNGVSNWQTCLMFNIHENNTSEEMLRYANAAYYGINSLKYVEDEFNFSLNDALRNKLELRRTSARSLDLSLSVNRSLSNSIQGSFIANICRSSSRRVLSLNNLEIPSPPSEREF